jgi:iron complex outermembrane receptor protein
MPKWKLRGSARYDSGPFGLYTQVRYVGSGKYSNSYGPEQMSAEDNKIGSEIYVDLSARYQLSVGSERTVELFSGVNNVFDNDPPALPSDFIAPAATNAVHYDVMGRFLYAGIRAKF